MIYLGLDISLNRTGWFVFTDDNMRVLGYGAVEHSTRKDEGEKLNNLYSEIDNVIKKYNPDGCGIEAEFVGQNRKTALKLGHCHGVTMLALKQNNIPFTYYSVMTLKSEVVEGINLINDNGLKKTGSELKAEVQNAILDIFGKEQFTVPYKTDETDAASAAYIYYKFKGIAIDNIKKKQKNTEKKKKEQEKLKREVKKATLKLQEKMNIKLDKAVEKKEEHVEEKMKRRMEQREKTLKKNLKKKNDSELKND